MEQALPDALAVFHAKMRLLFDDRVSIVYDDPTPEGVYTIDISLDDDRRLALVQYDSRRQAAFVCGAGIDGDEHRLETADVSELLTWMMERSLEAST